MSRSRKTRNEEIARLWDKNTNYTSYDGSDCFIYNGGEVCSVLDMWRYSYSHLLGQYARIAEFIVAKSLGIEKAENVGYWTAYDMTYRGMRIEVKETSYIHPWNEKNISTKRTFSIAPSKNAYWDSGVDEGEKSVFSRQSDVYVFCINEHKEINSADPLNLDVWSFYVIPTAKINEYAENNGNSNQKTISMGAVRRLASHSVRFGELMNEVDSVITSIIEETSYSRILEGETQVMEESVSLAEFVDSPEYYIRKATVGECINVKTGNGMNAIIIDESEWAMLRKALDICMEHPEWTIRT